MTTEEIREGEHHGGITGSRGCMADSSLTPGAVGKPLKRTKRTLPENSQLSSSRNGGKRGKREETPVSNQAFSAGAWSEEEQKRFEEGLLVHGNQWQRIADYVKTRSKAQVRSHTQKHFERKKKEALKKVEEMDIKPIFLITREYRNRTAIDQKKPYELFIDPQLKRVRTKKGGDRSITVQASPVQEQTAHPKLQAYHASVYYMFLLQTLEQLQSRRCSYVPPPKAPLMMTQAADIPVIPINDQDKGGNLNQAAVRAVDKFFEERIFKPQGLKDDDVPLLMPNEAGTK